MIPNQWYPIIESRKVRPGRPVGITRLGEKLVVWRDRDGKLVCMADRCSHRGAQLSLGKIRGGCIECPYHGLRFDGSGRCVLIPANGADTPVPRAFDLEPRLTHDEHGLLWLWNGRRELASRDLPWFENAPELGGVTGSLSYSSRVPYLRVIENLLDFHHLPFVHKWTFPGIGPRVDDFSAHEENGLLAMSLTMRYERPSRLRRPIPFRVMLRLPSNAYIDLAGARVLYAIVPEDKGTWIYARYSHRYLSRAAGGRILSHLFALLDRTVFALQDTPVLESQLDALADFSNYHLYEADRGIGLFFGMMRRAMREAEASSRDSAGDSAYAAADG